MDLLNSNFLMTGAVKGHILHQRTKFYKDRSNHYGDIAILWFFKIAAAAILIFLKFEILAIFPLSGANVRDHAKLHQKRSNDCRDMAIERFLK